MVHFIYIVYVLPFFILIFPFSDIVDKVLPTLHFLQVPHVIPEYHCNALIAFIAFSSVPYLQTEGESTPIKSAYYFSKVQINNKLLHKNDKQEHKNMED